MSLKIGTAKTAIKIKEADAKKHFRDYAEELKSSH